MAEAQQQQQQDFTEIAHACRHAREEALDDLLKRHEGTIKAANMRERKISRVGMPLSYRADHWSDEIPIVCGVKKAVVYLGGLAGCVLGGWKIKQLIFG
jgi:hypothetical protein